LDIDEVGLWK
jgi:hypothetical protein